MADGARGSVAEVFLAFLRLGLTSFGGPVAHIGFFREEFVVRRRWLGDRAYADLVALCQFLPGPASSQVGMALGLGRAGYAGMAAAWVGFTLPSALVMALAAFGAAALDPSGGALGGLKAAAVAVVAHALLGMARSLTPDRERATVAAAGMALALAVPGVGGQLGAIALGAALGLTWLRADAPGDGAHEPLGAAVPRRVALAALAAFALLLLALPLAAGVGWAAAMADSYVRAGALVFGGGHVVLPLLQAEVVGAGLVDRETFLAGYGAAQAVPGPLFTFASYLGAAQAGAAGAVVATLAIFAPSALLVISGLPFWDALRAAPVARRALAGVNAGVVGLLAAALYDPVFVVGVRGPADMIIAAGAFVALAAWRAPAWAVVGASAAAGAALAVV
jgi:chromate transporter